MIRGREDEALTIRAPQSSFGSQTTSSALAAVVGTIVCAALGCGSHPLVGSPTSMDAGARADAAVDVAPEAGHDAAASDVAPFCRLGTNQTCNDDPAQSSFAGTCRATPDSMGFYCKCAEGFSIHLGTGLCRAGTFCEAAAADPWPFTETLDLADCAARPTLACGDAGGDAGEVNLVGELWRIVSSCHNPGDIALRVELVSGCVSRVALRPDLSKTAPALVDCIVAALKTQRWTCAGDANTCSLLDISLIP